MAAPRKENRVSHLSWDAVSERLAAGAPAFLPVGAGAKQHGLHLAMKSDQIQAEWLASCIADEAEGLIWPTLTYGFYPAFEAYAGSVSLSATTFEHLVLDITGGLLSWCRSQVFVLDTGISTQPIIARALARTVDPLRCHHIKIYDGPRFRETAQCVSEQPHGSHADEIETSLMLALVPELADMTRAMNSPKLPGGVEEGPLTPTDAASPNYSPSGSFGFPQLATAEKGRALLAALEADALATVQAALGR